MFPGFANVWTPVAPSSLLRPGRPLALRVAGTPVVLFRDGDGRPAALVDRCPHRGVALSLGRVTGGRLECPFHGWQFDGRGHNCAVPWNPDAKLARLGAVALPARELAGQVWVFTGEVAEGEPGVEATFLRDDVRLCGFVLELATHWTRAMENMLDWPHLPFVHAGTIGKPMRGSASGRMDITLDERPWGFRSRIAIDGRPQPGALDYRFPNRMNLFVPVPDKTLAMEVSCVPVDDRRTRLVMMTARDFAKAALLDPLFNRQNRKIAGEDRVVVESSQPAAVPPPAEERSVRTDEPTLYFRRRYFADLRGSEASVAPAGARPVALRRKPGADERPALDRSA
ncbi:MAG TPA: aromatic ring-hydroxylating dioxygenase subunit alpha [Polyangiaceae bacterium]|nr:aromatic ring-hydroxylating dioxygenase subunit alpha [Polyangiaceae bacterium]